MWKEVRICNAEVTDGNTGPDCLTSKRSYKEEQQHCSCSTRRMAELVTDGKGMKM